MIDNNLSTYATVAQLVEQLIRNQQVAGSNPASSSKKQTAFRGGLFFVITSTVRTVFARGRSPKLCAPYYKKFQTIRRKIRPVAPKRRRPFGRRLFGINIDNFFVLLYNK